MRQKAIDQLAEGLSLHPDEPRLLYLNLLGIAQYVIGDYDVALRSFERNLDRKGSTDPHMDDEYMYSWLQLMPGWSEMIPNSSRSHLFSAGN